MPGIESVQRDCKVLLSNSVNLPGDGDRILIEIGWDLELELENGRIGLKICCI